MLTVVARLVVPLVSYIMGGGNEEQSRPVHNPSERQKKPAASTAALLVGGGMRHTNNPTMVDHGMFHGATHGLNVPFSTVGAVNGR